MTNSQDYLFSFGNIQMFNIMAFERKSQAKAKLLADNLGEKMFNIFQSAIDVANECNQNDIKEKIYLFRWQSVSNQFTQSNGVVQKYYNQKGSFTKAINNIAEFFVNHRTQNKASKSFSKKLQYVAKYILAEIPILVHGVHHNHHHFKVCLYPGKQVHLENFMTNSDSLCNLIYDIHNNHEFTSLKQDLKSVTELAVPGFVGLDVSITIQ